MRRKETVYLSGKISNLPRETYLARFAHAEAILKREGFAVINPTKFAPCRWLWLYNILGYEIVLLMDLWHLWRKTDRIFMIGDDWRTSRGAQIESFSAHVLGVRHLPHDQQIKLEAEMQEWIKNNEQTEQQP